MRSSIGTRNLLPLREISVSIYRQCYTMYHAHIYKRNILCCVLLRLRFFRVIAGCRLAARNFLSSLPLEFRSYLFPFYSVFATRIFTSACSISSGDDIVSDREKKKRSVRSRWKGSERERQRQRKRQREREKSGEKMERTDRLTNHEVPLGYQRSRGTLRGGQGDTR